MNYGLIYWNTFESQISLHVYLIMLHTCSSYKDINIILNRFTHVVHILRSQDKCCSEPTISKSSYSYILECTLVLLKHCLRLKYPLCYESLVIIDASYIKILQKIV